MTKAVNNRIKSLGALVPIIIVLMTSAFISFDSANYNIEKKYSIKQLQEDFKTFQDTLEKYHPRLYEFTDKPALDKLFDSLYTGINRQMNEIEFRHYLLPVICKIHCSHTGVGGSENFSKKFHDHYKYPPFKLFYEERKAYIIYNFSGNVDLTEGAEVVSLNNVPIKNIIDNFLMTTTLEGIHEIGQYYKMNENQTTLFNGMPDYFKQSTYSIQVKDKSGKVSKTIVPAINYKQYHKFLNEKSAPRKHTIKFIESTNTAILTFPQFQFPVDSMFQKYIPATFKLLQDKQTKNLILDLRGNGGGPGPVAANLLMHLLKHKFIYYDSTTTTGRGYEEFKRYVDPAPNAFTGNLYCLMDEGCLSSSGHFLSMIKYHKRGILVGGLCTAGYSCNGNGVPYTMPNSKIILYCPNAYWNTKTSGFTRAEGIKPDFEIRPTLSDLINKRDPVLQFALEQTMKN
jgi:hypothetical protein